MRDRSSAVARNGVAQGARMRTMRSYRDHSIEISGPSSTPCKANIAPVFLARLK